MAGNLNPSEDALHPEMIAVIKSMIEAIPAAERDTLQGRRELKVTSRMLDEPHIDVKALGVRHRAQGGTMRLSGHVTVEFPANQKYNVEP